MADATTVYRAHPTQDEMDEILAQRNIAEITPIRWRSWTNAVLKAESEKELDGRYADAFLPD